MPHQKSAIPVVCDGDPPFVVDHEFDDVDELGEVTRAWDLDFRQITRGGFKGGGRRDLRSSGYGETVSDIATRWGFLHMVQFAADYRRHFGELPSQTRLRASKRTAGQIRGFHKSHRSPRGAWR